MSRCGEVVFVEGEGGSAAGELDHSSVQASSRANADPAERFVSGGSANSADTGPLVDVPSVLRWWLRSTRAPQHRE